MKCSLPVTLMSISIRFEAGTVTVTACDHSQDLAMAALGYYSDCNNRWREIECFRLIGTINERAEDYPNARRCYQLACTSPRRSGPSTRSRRRARVSRR